MTIVAPQAVVGTNQGYRQAVMTSNPRIYFPLDDAPGSVIANEQMAGRQGTVVGGVTFGVADPWGGVASAQFDGSTGFIYESTYSPQLSGAPWSVELWYWTTKAGAAANGTFNFNSVPSSTSMTGAAFTTSLYLSTAYQMGGFISGNSPNLITENGVTNDGNWHHVVLTYQPGTPGFFAVYRDGVVAISSNCSGTVQTNQVWTQIGVSGNTTRGGWWTGRLCHFAQYNRALPASEVAAHFAAVYTPPAITTPPTGPPVYSSPEVLTIQRDSTVLDLTQVYQNGIAIAQKDFGAPAVREVVYIDADDDGAEDDTQFYGQRVIQLTGKCFSQPGQSRSKAFQLLVPFLDPAARCTMTFSMDPDTPPLQLRQLRVAQYSRVTSSPTTLDISLQWKADTAAYGLQQQSANLFPAGSGTTGRTYNLTFNRNYPAQAGGGSPQVVTSNGTYKTWPILRIYGPCTNPTVSWVPPQPMQQAGQVAMLYTVPAGQYVEIDTHERTVMLGGSGGSSQYSQLDFAHTIWNPMQPGQNTFTFTASSASTGTQLVVLWYDAFL